MNHTDLSDNDSVGASGQPASDPAALNEALIARLKETHVLADPRVEAAFRAVPRHLFLPDLTPEEAYRDEAIPTKRLQSGQIVSSSSQPSIMAIMLEQLALGRGQHVLEIGAGTGYNAALIAHLVGETGHVVSLDIDQDIVEAARLHLAHLAQATGTGDGRPGPVEVERGDGFLGYADAAPYDRIILTVASWDVAPAWREQLKPGGRLVLPLDIKRSQKCVALETRGDYLESLSVTPCGFMALRGAMARPDNEMLLRPGLYFFSAAEMPIDADAIYHLLTGPYHDLPTAVRITPGEIFDGLGLWLSLHEPALCGLSGEEEPASLVPFLFGVPGKWQSTTGVWEGESLCLLNRAPDSGSSPAPADEPDRHTPFALSVRCFGPGDSLASRLIDQIKAWDAAGRPGYKGMRIKVFPAASDYSPTTREVVVPTPWSKFVLDW